MSSRVTYAAVSDSGKRRPSNQDALLCDMQVLQGPSIHLKGETGAGDMGQLVAKTWPGHALKDYPRDRL
jgi:hypothetical protein